MKLGTAPRPCPIVAPDVVLPAYVDIEIPDVVLTEVYVVFIEPSVLDEP